MGKGWGLIKGQKEALGMMDIFVILAAVMLS